MKTDIALISGRRPELLERTLDSFDQNLFRHFDIGTCYANIDPFGGTPADGDRCEQLILSLFPDAVITKPATPGFGRAVKTVWSQVRSPVVFHMEDDWIALERIRPEDVLPLFSPATGSVRLLSQHLEWNRQDRSLRISIKRRFLGIPYRRVSIDNFGTSPAFFSGEFINRCAGLMDPDLDPEKQMRPTRNPRLFDFMQRYECRLLIASNGGELIRDIGREWRDAKGIKKVVSNGRSVWSQATT